MQPDPVALIATSAFIALTAGSVRPNQRFTECGETMNLRTAASVDHALDNHGSVGAAETERIGQRYINLAPARRLRYEIDCGLHRGIFQVDSRWGDAIANRQDAEDRLD